MSQLKIVLEEDELPKYWYNILPDLPEKLPPAINPATGEVVKPEELEMIFAKELVRQEGSQERFIKIPEEILDSIQIISSYSTIQSKKIRKVS